MVDIRCKGCKHSNTEFKNITVPCCDCARRYVDYFEMRDHTSYKNEETESK